MQRSIDLEQPCITPSNPAHPRKRRDQILPSGNLVHCLPTLFSPFLVSAHSPVATEVAFSAPAPLSAAPAAPIIEGSPLRHLLRPRCCSCIVLRLLKRHEDDDVGSVGNRSVPSKSYVLLLIKIIVRKLPYSIFFAAYSFSLKIDTRFVCNFGLFSERQAYIQTFSIKKEFLFWFGCPHLSLASLLLYTE